MPVSQFVRFFDKNGDNMNLGLTYSTFVSLYDGSVENRPVFEGMIYFPKVSIGLIESQQIYLLEEVTGPSSNFDLRKVVGSVQLVSGNPNVVGIDTDFSSLTGGVNVKIKETTYNVNSVSGPTAMVISPTPTSSVTTSDIYYYDYRSYNQLRSSPGTFAEQLSVTLSDSQQEFFLYSVNYNEDLPVIERFFSSDFQLPDGSNDIIDETTGRIDLTSGEILTLPTQINLGFSSGATALSDEIYEEKMLIHLNEQYQQPIIDVSVLPSGNIQFTISGNDYPMYDISSFHLQGVTGAGATATFFDSLLDIVSVANSGADTLIEVKSFSNPVGVSNLGGYRIFWRNKFPLAVIGLYAETEAEDERFRLVLENFGKSINFDSEYIFRDSDINEELPDYRLLNKKRKELLLEGDNIYPYMGSYKALINIINYFGYYDLRIKEYFLNVDANSPNYEKYLHVLVPKNKEQRELVKDAWQKLPSKIYKKTSLFGLFYDLNRATDQEDIYGIPEVEDAFDFSPEEVLIKLFGLKELLKRQFLPLNARIYDITGEGIYFKRIRVDSWADNLNHLEVSLGITPSFKVFPEGHTYLSDIRRMDEYYVKKFVEQGLTGFIGFTFSNLYLTAEGSTGPISNLYGEYALEYNFYQQGPYDTVLDETWAYMPPGIADPNFNAKAAMWMPLTDDENILAAGPILLEATFEISWEDSSFSWADLGILGPSGSPININHWTWESIGRGEFIEMRWVVEKGGENGFYYDSGRKPIGDYKVDFYGNIDYSRPAVVNVVIGESGSSGAGSVISVNLLDRGFGYTSAPAITVASPGGTGMTATITATINSQGNVNTLSFTPGSGYDPSINPLVTVERPAPIYEVTQRYLHALALPYTGDYQIGLYLYDITNGFSVNYQKYTVKNWNVDFSSIFRKETPERTWQDFEKIPNTIENSISPRLLTWQDVTGPWYYPLHVHSKWEDAKTSWESLNYSSYEKDSLYEYQLNTSIISIDRNGENVVLQGDLTGNLQNLNVLNVGDYLFFSRNESDPIGLNLLCDVDSFGSRLKGLSGSDPYDALVSGSTGSSTVTTGIYDTSTYLASGDELWIQGKWYTVENVGATSVQLTSPLVAAFTDVGALHYPLSGEIPVSFTGASGISMQRYSKVLVCTNPHYESIDPGSDYYLYLDSLSFQNSSFIGIGDNIRNKTAMVLNSSLSGSSPLYLSWGVFSGTYAIQITNISLTGSNTLFRLDDVNRELYYLDGNFSVRLADYDVDYAENRIGPKNLNYQSANETTWSENDSLTWQGLEYHGGSLCGFVIPFVSPGGSITIDEEPTFTFSGNFAINSTKAGLQIAAEELNLSLNPGILKYDYAVLPEDEIYIRDFSGSEIDVASNVAPGATQIPLSTIPNFSLKIPAVISVGISGGSVVSATILNPGWGYTEVPTITVSSPVSGSIAKLSCSLTGSPYYGQVFTVSIDDPGSGYSSAPTAFIDSPSEYKAFDNFVWTGSEWLEVESVVSNVLVLAESVTYPISSGDFLLLPYQYHKQLFKNKDLFQQFYYFIQGKAKSPGHEMLSYVEFTNGVESEWLNHPFRTYTYPLRNSFFFLSVPQYNDLRQDILYKKWEYEGSDYPPLTISSDYSSDVLSYQSRIPYAQTTQDSFSYIDVTISPYQQRVKQYTPVVFSYSNCRIPGKKNPIWSIYNEDERKVEVMSREKQILWNFTKTGNFTVSLQIEDSNGNISFGQKNSFIIV